jgi:hypothetical protein
MDSAPKRPWYRLHMLTCLVLVVIGYTLIDREVRRSVGFPISSLSYVSEKANHQTLSWFLLFCLLLITATVHVFELWLRSPNRLHLSLGSLFCLIGVAAILTGIVNGDFYDSLVWLGLPTLLLISWDDLRHPLNWPLLLALGCTIYSLGWLVCFVVLRLWSLVRRRPA